MSLSVFLVGLVVVGLLIADGISLNNVFNKNKIIDTILNVVIIVTGIWFICGTFEQLPREPYELFWQK